MLMRHRIPDNPTSDEWKLPQLLLLFLLSALRRAHFGLGESAVCANFTKGKEKTWQKAMPAECFEHRTEDGDNPEEEDQSENLRMRQLCLVWFLRMSTASNLLGVSGCLITFYKGDRPFLRRRYFPEESFGGDSTVSDCDEHDSCLTHGPQKSA